MPGVSLDQALLRKADAEPGLHQLPHRGLAVGADDEVVALEVEAHAPWRR